MLKAKTSNGRRETAPAPKTAPSRRIARAGLLPGDHGAPGAAAAPLVAATVPGPSTLTPGGEVRTAGERVNRRAGSPLVDRLPAPLREAASIYATAFEIVAAGGVSAGGVAEKTDGSGGSREGRQAGALAWADRLRTLDAAIGAGSIRLDARGRSIPIVEAIRGVVVGGLSLSRLLAAKGFKRTAPRERALRTGIEAGLTRAAIALGLEKTDDAGNIG